MSNVASLWIGGQLSIPHKIALSSFLYYGHNVKLYVYDNSIAVPKGVIKEDARKILGEDKIFTHFGKYAAFSDFFRYAMIAKTGEVWVDTDTFCFSEDFFDDKEYVFVEEAENIYCGNILKMPKDSDLTKWLYSSSRQLIKSTPPSTHTVFHESFSRKSWVYLGPGLLTDGVNKFNISKYAIAKDVGHLVDIHNEDPRDIFWNPEYSKMTMYRISKSPSGSFFNSWLDQREFNKDFLPEGSAMKILFDMFMSNQEGKK